MNLPELIAALQRHAMYGGSRMQSAEVVIPVLRPGTLGPSPAVGLARVEPGMDWDHGRVFLHPAGPLTSLDPVDVRAINESVRKGQSWHAYQQYKRQDEANRKLRALLDDAMRMLGSRRTELAPEFCGADGYTRLLAEYNALDGLLKKEQPTAT